MVELLDRLGYSDKQISWIKYVYGFCNIFFAAMGCFYIYVGVKLLEYNVFLPITIVGILCGCLAILLGISGFVVILSTKKKSWIYQNFKIQAYVNIVLLIALACIMFGYLGAKMKETREEMEKSMNETNPDQSYPIYKWNNWQWDYKCCGIDSYLDWENSIIRRVNHEMEHQMVVPKSCCKNRGCHTEVMNATFQITKIRTQGCFDKYLQETKIKLICGAVVNIGMACVAAIDIVFTVALENHKVKEKGPLIIRIPPKRKRGKKNIKSQVENTKQEQDDEDDDFPFKDEEEPEN